MVEIENVYHHLPGLKCGRCGVPVDGPLVIVEGPLPVTQLAVGVAAQVIGLVALPIHGVGGRALDQAIELRNGLLNLAIVNQLLYGFYGRRSLSY